MSGEFVPSHAIGLPEYVLSMDGTDSTIVDASPDSVRRDGRNRDPDDEPQGSVKFFHAEARMDLSVSLTE
jgi:hypothetical protein